MPSASDSFQTGQFSDEQVEYVEVCERCESYRPLPHHVAKELAKGQAFPIAKLCLFWKNEAQFAASKASKQARETIPQAPPQRQRPLLTDRKRAERECQ